MVVSIVDPFFSAGARIDTWLQLAATDPNYPNAWLKIETHPIAVLIYDGSAAIFVTGLMTDGAVLHFFKSVPRGGHRRPPRGTDLSRRDNQSLLGQVGHLSHLT